MQKLFTYTLTMNLLVPGLFCIHDAAKLFYVRFLKKYLRSAPNQDSPSCKSKGINRTRLLLARETPVIDSINQRPRKLALELQRWTSGRCSLWHFSLIIPIIFGLQLNQMVINVVAHAVIQYCTNCVYLFRRRLSNQNAPSASRNAAQKWCVFFCGGSWSTPSCAMQASLSGCSSY